AQALNAKGSGWPIQIHLSTGSSRIQEAKEQGLEILTDPAKAAARARIAVLLIPDTAQPEFYQKYLEPNLPKGASLIFAHGFNIHFKQIVPRPDLNCLLVAPALAGTALRQNYLEKEEVPILTAVHQDADDTAYRLVEDYAGAIGGKKVKLFPTTFKEETETDLFAEQVVVCGGINALVKRAFETLVAAGYNPEVAYYSCLKEIKGTTAENLYRYGIQGFRQKISQTALYGDLTRGPRIINEKTAQEMRVILNEICTGKFTEELMDEKRNGWPTLKQRMKEEENHPIEKVRDKVDQ
ncbi:MAG: ketol-acid reductoisomerase, partial [Deltaproteobacteria bacterium]|nr:ketol-acid reductoisomerase [Deltaproteobacteria bacterium]